MSCRMPSILLFLLLFSFLNSCSSDKKVYAPGYLEHDAVSTETWLLVSEDAKYHLTYTRTGDKIKGHLKGLNNIDRDLHVQGVVNGSQIQFTAGDGINQPQEFKGTISDDGQSMGGPCSFEGNWGFKWSAANINRQF